MVGTTVQTVAGLRVEPGKVEEFARAITDENPIFRDPAVAAERGFDAVPAPLTFTRTADFPRYRPPTFEGQFGLGLGFDLSATLHGEQAYTYHRHPVVGDVLSATATLEDVYQREGSRGGRLTFAVIGETYEDQDGKPVLSTRNTQIETSQSPRSPQPDGGTSGSDIAGLTLNVGKLDRTSFVRYAGASGDFVRVHYDEPYAHASGYDTVFAQGMLIAGLASRFITDRFGLAAIRRFRTRFEAQVWPGEDLVVIEESTERHEVDGTPVTDAPFAVETAQGRVVLTGDVTADAPP